MKHSRNKLLASLLLASAAATAVGHAQTTVSTFTGGDEGEGLDLKGNFTYAVNVSTGGPAGRVGDALFTADNTAGVTVLADNNIPDWLATNYGDSENDNNLEFVLRSIRWTAAPGNVTVRMNVESGVKYKLQILFGESCCRGRGFDININGALAVDEFIPAAVQGDSLPTVGAVVTHEFTASSDTLEFVLDGTTADSAEINDHNPILNGFTLERLTAPGDLDGDGLPDDWEKKFFGNLDAQPGGDADADGLTNLQEFQRGTSPTDNDSDDDGLKDGDEVNTHHSDPLLKDSDGDRVPDGLEVNTYHTDPTKTDSDGDGTNDYDELRLHTNPADKNSVPTFTSLGSFTGGDPGEGLDLQGTFPYALNVGGIDPSQAGDALFLPITEAEVTGATLVAGNQIANWFAPAFGDSADDDAIEVVMQSIRWSNFATDIPAVELTLDNLDVGAEYKLQLLFAESCCAGRAFDIYVNGQLLVDEFNPSIYQGGVNNQAKSAVVTHTFVANAATAVIRLDGRGITTPEFGDHNAIFNGMTLERLAAKVDADGDQLPDAWETRFFGNTAQGAAGDPDGDGITNADEFKNGTNPASADTDGDGLSDSAEKTAGTDAGNPDSDFDGISDGDEVNVHHSNPLSKDSDGDGLSDSMEILTTKTDPSKADSDGDGFDDVTEIFSKTNPTDAASKPRKTVIRPFTGGDEGDGLVFKAQPGGKFLYAVSIGGNPGGVTVGDATFTDETAEGLTVTSGATIASWVAPEFGDSANDDALEQAIVGIRHGPPITVNMTGLKPGGAYRLQLMFFEGCCSRGFDVSVNGEKIADDFAPYVVQGGIANKPKGAGITHRFIATSDTLTVVLEGNTVAVPAYTDHNPILNAATLEEIAPPGDKDADGLSDPWEIENFGSIAAQDGNGDPDGDGLNNTGEFAQNSDPNNKDSDGDGLSDKEEKDAATNPNSADTDGDGLSDSDELNKYHTDATKADADGDGLNDSQEVLIYHSDPAKSDTDGDTFPDNWEAFSGTDLADASSKPDKLLIRPFTGGDAGDGLDLDGTFKYAINVGTAGAPSTAGLPDKVRDATFTADDVEGVKITAPNQIANWHAPDYGETDADNTIEYVLQSMRWSTGPVRADLSGLTPGRTYKLQLLFAESCCSRGFDLRIDGQLVVNDFFIPAVQGGINNPKAGALIAYTFVAGDDTLNIALEGAGVTNPQITDHNPTLSGITLEDIGNVVLPPASPTVSSAVRSANGFAITFASEAGRSYTLEHRANAEAGNWSPVSDTVSATGSTTTLTDNNAARLAAPTGFYRVRAQ